jgi:S-adenosylmethionine/arginine decarboxylase-like enzyme
MALAKDDETLDEIIKDFIESGGMSLLDDDDFKEDNLSSLTMHNWEQGENRSLKQAHRLMKEKYKTRFLTSKPQKRGFKRSKESLAKRY